MSVQLIATSTVALSATTLLALRLWRSFLAETSSEPPLLSYWLPWLGHALEYGRNNNELFARAEAAFPGSKPYSLLIAGQRFYVFTNSRDVALVYRNSRSLTFDPLVAMSMKDVFGLSDPGLRALHKEDESGDTLLKNTHTFYRDALKPGPQLDLLTDAFLGHLEHSLTDNTSASPMEVSFLDWTRTVLAIASTNAMFGRKVLADNPTFLKSFWIFDRGHMKFVLKIPRWLARKEYEARETMIRTLSEYFREDQSSNRDAALPMIPARERMLRDAEMSDEDIARGHFALYFALQANAIPTAAWALLHICATPGLATRLRTEIAPALDQSGRVINVTHLLQQCPLLRATYNETLRLSSSSISNRIVEEDTIISGYTLRKGAMILLPARFQHVSTEIWGPDAAVFRPERFLEAESKANLLRPFGGGTSLCSGRHFAGNEVLSFVAIVIQRFDLEIVEGETFPVADEKSPNLGVMNPATPVRVRISPRASTKV